MAKKRAPRSDSIQGQRQAVLNAMEEVHPPEGVKLRHETDWIIWRQLARARVPDDWTDYALICLARIVRFETDIRELDDQIDTTGLMLRSKKGFPIKNPLLEIREGLLRQ